MDKITYSLPLLKRFALAAFFTLTAFDLTGCASQTPGAFSTHPVTPITTAAGATAGGLAGLLTRGGSAVPYGILIGGAFGLAVGLYADSSPSLIRKLNSEGIQTIQLGDQLRIIIYTDQCFELNSAVIDDTCKNNKLNNLAMLLKHYGNVPIKVSGYTDDVVDPVQAQLLSEQQATSIVTFLWTRGIPFQNFHITGYGEEDPIATNHTVQGRAFNRRVELSLWTNN